MAAYFDVTGEVYRIFIHKTLLDLDGTGFMSSYILEYDEQMSEGRDDSFTLLFTHEMVHSFALIEPDVYFHPHSYTAL